jgi:3-oxosteroid 1-dehydrogenase
MAGLDEGFDFVVVGSGGDSMCAALLLRQAGKSVVILEKTDQLGGSTARAGGVMWNPNNLFMAPARLGPGETYRHTMIYRLSATAPSPA